MPLVGLTINIEPAFESDEQRSAILPLMCKSSGPPRHVAERLTEAAVEALSAAISSATSSVDQVEYETSASFMSDAFDDFAYELISFEIDAISPTPIFDSVADVVEASSTGQKVCGALRKAFEELIVDAWKGELPTIRAEVTEVGYG